MIHVTFGPLEGILVCLCRTLIGEEPFHGVIVPFDLSWRVENPKDGCHTPQDGKRNLEPFYT
jgi:hypothetical protein